MTNIFEKPFGIADGRAARLFVLESEDLSVGLTDLGCTLVFVRVKAAGVNAVLGYPDAGGYARGTSCVGASVGRYAGRIGNARFTLNGREYALERNDGENHLHGGFQSASMTRSRSKTACGSASQAPIWTRASPASFA